MAGAVEVDESYLGGAEEGVRGRQTEDKSLIVVAAEEDGRGIGRIRLRHIRDASASSLLPFVTDSIEPGSTVHTDGWLGYLPLEANGYRELPQPLRAAHTGRGFYRRTCRLSAQDRTYSAVD